jgi:ribosomal protein S18 acetylase RimI-like enzyme
MFFFRQLVAEDVDQARDLVTRVYTETFGSDVVARWHSDIRNMESQYLASDRQAGFVALHGPKVVGFAAIRHRSPQAGPLAGRYDPDATCELGRLTVEPAFRRRGIALQLVELARLWAGGRYRVISLHTDDTNHAALALWRHLCVEVMAHEGTVYFELPLDRPVTCIPTPEPRP